MTPGDTKNSPALRIVSKLLTILFACQSISNLLTILSSVGIQLIEASHVSKVTHRESSCAGQLALQIVAQGSIEAGPIAVFRLHIHDVTSQQPVERKHLRVDRNGSFYLGTLIANLELRDSTVALCLTTKPNNLGFPRAHGAHRDMQDKRSEGKQGNEDQDEHREVT